MEYIARSVLLFSASGCQNRPDPAAPLERHVGRHALVALPLSIARKIVCAGVRLTIRARLPALVGRNRSITLPRIAGVRPTCLRVSRRLEEYGIDRSAQPFSAYGCQNRPDPAGRLEPPIRRAVRRYRRNAHRKRIIGGVPEQRVVSLRLV